MLFSPVWVLVLKLHGLYDHDHRRIRHSTLDELPALVSASALGTLALDGLLALSPAGALSPCTAILVGLLVFAGSFTARAVLRFSWQRLTGVAVGLVIGPGDGADRVARRIATHPEARLRLAGYLGPAGQGDGAAGLPRLGSIEDIARVAQEQGVERVIVTEQQEMSEAAAERLIEECKAAGLGLTFLPQHYGLLGPGIELNRLAELPVLDFRFSDPPRSTIAMKRAMDVVVSGLLLALLSPVLLAIAALILLDSGRPGPLPPAARGQGRRALHDAEVPDHGRRRRGAARRAGRPREARPARLQDPGRPAGDPQRPLPAPHQPRRAAAADQRARRLRCRWSARGPRRRRSSPSTTSASACGSGSSRA